MKFNSNVTVLYLDDEVINLKVIELTLGRYFNVLIFSNVSDALNEITNNSNITHVISDLLMPDTNGIEFIKTTLSRKKGQIMSSTQMQMIESFYSFYLVVNKAM